MYSIYFRLLGDGCDRDADDYQATGDVDISDSGKELTILQRIMLFYDAPKITFRHNVVSEYKSCKRVTDLVTQTSH